MERQSTLKAIALFALVTFSGSVLHANPLRAQSKFMLNDEHHFSSLKLRVDAVCSKSGLACPHLTIDDLTNTPLEAKQDKIVVSSSFAQLPRSPVEELALAALIVAWFNQPDASTQSKRSDLPQQLLALGMLGLGEKIDPIHDQADRNRRSDNFRYRGNSASWQSPALAQRALALATSTGSCSGALVNVLNRARTRSTTADQHQRSQDIFARSILSQLGSSIMPPDNSCV